MSPQLDCQNSSIDCDGFAPILSVLKAAAPRTKFTIVGVGGVPGAISVHLSSQRRRDSFTIHLSLYRQLAWIGSERFFTTEPNSRTSRDFLSALQDRIDGFFHGVASVAGGRDNGE
ncbi:MAG: hypothetical protein WA733_09055 [Methylocystis sp.]